MFLNVVAGSVTTSTKASAAPIPTVSNATAAMTTICRRIDVSSGLSPGTQVVRRSTDQAATRGTAVHQATQPHVHRRRLAVPHTFTARQQLFKRVRQ